MKTFDVKTWKPGMLFKTNRCFYYCKEPDMIKDHKHDCPEGSILLLLAPIEKNIFDRNSKDFYQFYAKGKFLFNESVIYVWLEEFDEAFELLS